MDTLELASFIVSTITAVCALYISYVSLEHSAKPRGVVRLIGARTLSADDDVEVRFEFKNLGHWYSKPPIVELDAWMNFDPAFQLQTVRYGSALELEDVNVRIGKGGLKYLKAKGMKIAFGPEGEPVAVRLRSPAVPGRYQIRVEAFSENGASIRQRWMVRVRK